MVREYLVFYAEGMLMMISLVNEVNTGDISYNWAALSDNSFLKLVQIPENNRTTTMNKRRKEDGLSVRLGSTSMIGFEWFDPQLLVEHFNPIGDNTGVLEFDVVDDSTCLMLLEDVRDSMKFKVDYWLRGTLRKLQLLEKAIALFRQEFGSSPGEKSGTAKPKSTRGESVISCVET
ncbi:hypothetical protein Tco_0508340 [Tanacetum coccineum]